MKIGRGKGADVPPRPASSNKASSSKTAAAEGAAASTPASASGGDGGAANIAPADAVTFLGVPETEMTPRVRAALTQLMEEAADLRLQLAEARTRLKEMSALAYTDPLLGILNRRAFVAELNRALARVDRHGEKASLAYFDLDGMKAVNDAHGHAAGDAALVHVADIILANIRQTDAFGRLGGDEFGVIFSHADVAAARKKTASLIAAVRASPLSYDGAPLDINVSAGVAAIEKGATAESALAVADAAMYAGKRRKEDSDEGGGDGGGDRDA